MVQNSHKQREMERGEGGSILDAKSLKEEAESVLIEKWKRRSNKITQENGYRDI